MSKRCYKSQLKYSKLYNIPIIIIDLYGILLILPLAYLGKWPMNFTIGCIVFMAIITHILGSYHANRLKEWDMGGYQELIIDSTNRRLVFDKVLEVDFNKIESIEAVIYQSHPPYPIGSSFGFPNAEILFNLRYGTQINFHVHFYNHLFSMVKHFKKLGLPVKPNTLNVLRQKKLKQELSTYIYVVVVVGILLYYYFKSQQLMP